MVPVALGKPLFDSEFDIEDLAKKSNERAF